MNMEARPSECRAANKQLTKLVATEYRTQASATAVKDMKRRIAKRLIKAMEAIDVRMNKPREFKELKHACMHACRQ